MYVYTHTRPPPPTEVDSSVALCFKTRKENVNLKEMVDNLRRDTTILRENTEKSNKKIKTQGKDGRSRKPDWQQSSNRSQESARKS